MRIARRFLAAGALALLVPAAPLPAQQVSPSTPAPLPSVALPAALDRVLRDYERAWIARDAKALAALFTPDGLLMRPGFAPVRGTAAIEVAYQGAGGPLALRAFAYAFGQHQVMPVAWAEVAAALCDADDRLVALQFLK